MWGVKVGLDDQDHRQEEIYEIKDGGGCGRRKKAKQTKKRTRVCDGRWSRRGRWPRTGEGGGRAKKRGRENRQELAAAASSWVATRVEELAQSRRDLRQGTRP